ncbi:tyrosine-type recombinase/integrase [Pseudomonas violetae]|uniref:Site-specific integrase n=1 Tax=Pseudomonas violetae TaxID=2915813 RepID=A0ABT0F1E0_9PSED|nr:site-specific integrase [Pseudomonas violetae]MCK1791684.1 site-specific integrase [Pseudomonas violetae]
MHLEKVPGINWQGRQITAVMILRDGPLSNESVVFPPTLHLLHLAKIASINTQMAIGADLKRLFESLEVAGVPWDQLSDDQMSGYIERTLLAEYNLSKRSIARHCSSIQGMYSQLSQSGFTDKNFKYSFNYQNKNGENEEGLSRYPDNPKPKRKYINDPLFETLLEHASETSGFLRARNELILELGHKLGLRSFEVTHSRNLIVNDLKDLLSLSKKTNRLSISLTIFGKRKKYRDVNVPPELLEKISEFIAEYSTDIQGNNLICAKDGSILSPSFASRLFKTVRDAALPKLKSKLNKLRKQDDAPYTISWNSVQLLTFHCLRHTYATNLVTYCDENNIDPCSYLPDQLGHTKSKTTKQYINCQATIYNRDKGRSRYSLEDQNLE